MTDVFVGIDLGTTTTLIARATEVEGQVSVKVLGIDERDKDGERINYLPSLAYFEPGKPPLVGMAAQRAGMQDTRYLVRAVKRQMGRRLVVPQAGILPYNVAALYLQKALDEAKYQMVGDYVFTVTVPASFTSNQRADTLKALKLACERSGVEFPKEDAGQVFISEPVAAVLAFINNVLRRPAAVRDIDLKKVNFILVYDIGGGTCDLTLVAVEPKNPSIAQVTGLADLKITVKAISYYNPFGGEDFDELVAKELHRRLLKAFPELESVTLNEDERSSLRLQLMNIGKKVKENLSVQEIELAGDLFPDEENSYFCHERVRVKGKEYALECPITWDEFVAVVSPLLGDESRKSLVKPLIDLLNKEKVLPEKLAGLLIVGGMGRLPLVQKKLEEYWGNNKVWLYPTPDHAVVTGAAIYSYLRKTCPGFNLDEPAADSYYVRTEDGFDPILPGMKRQGEPRKYRLSGATDKLVLQVFAGEEPEPGKPLETIYHTLIYQGGTTIKLKKEYPKDTLVWIQMRYDDDGEGQNHTKVPWVDVWVQEYKEGCPDHRLRYTELIQEEGKEDNDEKRI